MNRRDQNINIHINYCKIINNWNENSKFVDEIINNLVNFHIIDKDKS